jgi:MinD-like ATPase involved in chromosome partitioning or flagellar assembly
MPDLVDVPENAVREEPIAFGLTAQQLLVCGIAVGIAAVIGLLPVWFAIQVVLTVLVAGPVLLAAILPIRNEPAYRWLVRAIRFRRQPRTWHAVLEAEPHKSQISDEAQNVAPPPVATASLLSLDDQQGPVDPREESAPSAQEQTSMGERTARLRVVDPDDDEGPAPDGLTTDGAPHERPAAIPHVLPGLRVVVLTSFAGGVGKTTLAVEVATLIASRARIRSLEGTEQQVRVLILDAARLASAVGLRLGLDPAALAAARNHRIWRDPSAVSELAQGTRWAVDVVTLPPHPQLTERDGHLDAGAGAFGAAEADAMLEGIQRAGYHLLVADLGGVLEEGHRQLIDQADVVLGVVRPTLESLPDVFRIAAVLRGQGMGRKLAIVANGADDDTEISRLAREADVPLVGRVSADPVFTISADRGEPAWSTAAARAGELVGVARAAWPLLGDGPGRATRRRSVLRAVRDAMPAPGGHS